MECVAEEALVLSSEIAVDCDYRFKIEEKNNKTCVGFNEEYYGNFTS
jgi:hypothetical protein